MSRNPIDIDTARRLLNDMSAHLAALPQDSSHAALRAEVEQLRELLSGEQRVRPEVRDRMQAVHTEMGDRADELRAEGIQVGMFLRDIGRMLGLD